MQTCKVWIQAIPHAIWILFRVFFVCFLCALMTTLLIEKSLPTFLFFVGFSKNKVNKKKNTHQCFELIQRQREKRMHKYCKKKKSISVLIIIWFHASGNSYGRQNVRDDWWMTKRIKNISLILISCVGCTKSLFNLLN